MPNKEEWWSKRAMTYDRLGWTTSDPFLSSGWRFADIKDGDHVWDVGCGTGTFELYATHYNPNIYMLGTDKNKDMIKVAKGKLYQLTNLYRPVPRDMIKFAQHDLDSFMLPHELVHRQFEVVYMRNVMHHVNKRQEAMDEIYAMVRPGGHFVLISAVPPSEKIADWYEEVFRIKDGRTVLWPHDIIDLFNGAGFENIVTKEHIVEKSSVKNWLNNNALSWCKKRKILKMHKNIDEIGKKAYNMIEAPYDKSDLLIDIRFLMVKGYKSERDK